MTHDILAEIRYERDRQITVEGFSYDHDDQYTENELPLAAVSYLLANRYDCDCGEKYWPWDWQWYKPSDDLRRNLIKAGALILAEIERLDRLG